MKYIEATLIFPITILIVVALIKLIVVFYCDLGEQVELHDAERDAIYAASEVYRIRVLDVAKQGI